jgi:choline dehydrogenase-like flavoprotein
VGAHFCEQPHVANNKPPGGTSGCVVAGRLAEGDPGLSILVIEGGPNNLDVPTIVHPALLLSGLVPTSKATIFYQGEKESQLNDRELIVPSGGTLGGGSSINLMMYSRAQRSDFDAWNVPGWATEDMIPYMKKVCTQCRNCEKCSDMLSKLETYHGPGPKALHGFEGPINVSRGTYHAARSESDWIQAAEKVGYPEIEDLASLDANNGFQRALRYVGTDGTRQDTAYRYIHPKIKSGDYPNLHVVVNSKVKRVVFKNKRASGVEYKPNPEACPDGGFRTIRARKLVIVSGGALGTPSILERSGLGNPAILKEAGVGEVIADLPGIGENYQDHHLMVYPYLSALEEHETLDALVRGRWDVAKLIEEKAPILGWNAADITYKIRPTDAEAAALGPDFQALWDEEYKNDPYKPLVSGSCVNA